MLMDPQSNPYLEGPYAPTQREVEIEGLEVIGQLPADLHGAYVRNGPNPRYPTQGRHHWFDGDGMVHGIYFEGGKASYRNRYVRTEAFLREERAGHSLWSGLMEGMARNPKDAPVKDTANTDVIYHNGQVLALWYLAGKPYALNPRTLETIGAQDFGGKLEHRVSAHAKVDARTQEMFFFDQRFTPPYLVYGVVDAKGELAHVAPIDLPGPRQPHDMAITERYAILMDLPLFADPEALRAGRYRVEFHGELPSRFGIIGRRAPGESIRWFEAKPCYIYHVVNAWESDDGEEITMVGCRVKEPQPKTKDQSPLARMLAFLRLDAQLYQWRFNLRTGQTIEGPLDDDNTEFPTIRAELCGYRSRYAYNVHLSDDPTMRFDGLFKYDLETQAISRHWFGEDRYGSESPFVPRQGATQEDDGYLLSIVHDVGTGRSEVVVLDAQDVEGEPLARVILPQRVPLGFHAVWVDGQELARSVAP